MDGVFSNGDLLCTYGQGQSLCYLEDLWVILYSNSPVDDPTHEHTGSVNCVYWFYFF